MYKCPNCGLEKYRINETMKVIRSSYKKRTTTEGSLQERSVRTSDWWVKVIKFKECKSCYYRILHSERNERLTKKARKKYQEDIKKSVAFEELN